MKNDEPKERGILMSGPMVRATREDRKTQTRRVVQPQRFWGGELMALWGESDEWVWNAPDYPDGESDRIHCPYGKIGDRLWVRETWYDGLFDRTGADGREDVLYRADGEAHEQVEDYMDLKWRPSIFMPRWASRITLEITNVRVERLNEISEDDARAEGVNDEPLVSFHNDLHSLSYRKGFKTLWDAINGKRGFGWDKNPYVWVIEFKKI